MLFAEENLVKLGEKPLSRELPVNFLNRKIDYHVNRYLTMVKIDKKIFVDNQRRIARYDVQYFLIVY